MLRANGDRDRFLALLEEYKKAERVTRDRLHLEAVERVLSGVSKKTIIDAQLGRGTLPLLPLGDQNQSKGTP